MGSSRLTLPLDTVTHGQASGDTRRAASEPVGHDRHASGQFEKAIRPTEMALFTNLYLLIHGEFLKTSVIQSVELLEYYNFTIMIMASFELLFKLQRSKVGYSKTVNRFRI